MSNVTMKFEVKERLEQYVPFLLDFFQKRQIPWGEINKKFLETYITRKEKYDEETKNGIPHKLLDVNFYDVITGIMKEDLRSISFIKYLEFVISDLDKNLSLKGKEGVCSIIRHLLKDFTRDYLNYLGELSVLNNLLKTDYILDKVECRITLKETNKKTVDFRLIKKDTNKPILVEVMNIHINEESTTDYETFKLYFSRKLDDKIKDKTKGDREDFTFFIVPVLWGTSKDLLVISSFFKNDPGIHYNQITEPFSYGNLLDSTGINTFKFGKISTVFEETLTT